MSKTPQTVDPCITELLTMIHIMPAFVYAVDNGMIKGTKKMPTYMEYLLASGGLYDYRKHRLTIAGESLLPCVDMIRYLVQVSPTMMEATLGVKPINPFYHTLRKGLGQLAEQVSFPLYDKVLKAYHTMEIINPLVLDYCGGNGQYLKHVLDLVSGTGILIDKDITETVDAFVNTSYNVRAIQTDVTTPMWYNIYMDTFDIILVNEVLHLGNTKWQEDVFKQCEFMLKPGGMLIVGEVQPSPAFDWRMDVLTAGKGSSVSDNNVVDVCHSVTRLFPVITQGSRDFFVTVFFKEVGSNVQGH